MKRRTYLKSVFAVAGLGLTSFSLFKWIDAGQPLAADALWEKKLIIAELAETIIPRTDTPGAKDAQVETYIITVLLNCNTIRQQHKFYDGVLELEQYAKDQYGLDYIKCNQIQKNEVLLHFSKNALYSHQLLNKINNKLFGQPFFSKLKSLTVEGYCNSQPGATKGLAYDYIPGNFIACIPLQINQKSWATK